MKRMNARLAAAMAAVMVVTASPVAATEEGTSNWLGSVGDFVRSGLGPPRTIEDIRREEERAREAAPAAPRPAAEPVKVVAPPAAPHAPVEEIVPPAAVAAPNPGPEPVAAPAPLPAPVIAAPAAPAPIPPAKEPAVKPAEARPAPPPPARPQAAPVRAVVPPPPPPEPLSSRIAATATAAQALKLGGSADIYSQRIRKPVRN